MSLYKRALWVGGVISALTITVNSYRSTGITVFVRDDSRYHEKQITWQSSDTYQQFHQKIGTKHSVCYPPRINCLGCEKDKVLTEDTYADFIRCIRADKLGIVQVVEN